MAKVLVIEDDQDILDVLVYVLQDDGFEVVTSTNSSILKNIGQIKPDIILLDEWLAAEEKGSDLCRTLKSNQATSRIPVLLVSALTPIESVVAEANADGYIKKPFDIEMIAPTIRAVLEK